MLVMDSWITCMQRLKMWAGGGGAVNNNSKKSCYIYFFVNIPALVNCIQHPGCDSPLSFFHIFKDIRHLLPHIQHGLGLAWNNTEKPLAKDGGKGLIKSQDFKNIYQRKVNMVSMMMLFRILNDVVVCVNIYGVHVNYTCDLCKRFQRKKRKRRLQWRLLNALGCAHMYK
jgi:hypothetical protein